MIVMMEIRTVIEMMSTVILMMHDGNDYLHYLYADAHSEVNPYPLIEPQQAHCGQLGHEHLRSVNNCAIEHCGELPLSIQGFSLRQRAVTRRMVTYPLIVPQQAHCGQLADEHLRAGYNFANEYCGELALRIPGFFTAAARGSAAHGKLI